MSRRHSGERSARAADAGTASRASVAIVTPTFYGAGTGASNHYGLLARWLLERGHEVEVFSERVDPAWREPRLTYHGTLPLRTSLGKTDVRAYVAYALENMRLPGVLRSLAKVDADVVLLHSAIASRPVLGARVFERLRAATRGVLVLDVRDVLSERGVRNAAPHCHAIASCGDAVDTFLAAHAVPVEKVFRLGVAQAPLRVDRASVERVRHAFSLQAPYVIYTGMLKPSKGVDRLADAFARLMVRRPDLGVELVLVGHLKSAQPAFHRALDRPFVRRLAPQDSATTMALVAGARLHVNPSRNESFGRSTLEALALGIPCIAPAGVPEFAQLGPRFVAAKDVTTLADQIGAHLDQPIAAHYDVRSHRPEAVFATLTERFGL